MKKREKSNNILKLLIMIFAITILVARVGSVKGNGDGGGSVTSPVEQISWPVTIDSASPTDVSVSFTPVIGQAIAQRDFEVYLGRISTFLGTAIGTPGDTIKWRVTVTGPANKWLTPDMIDLDEVGWEDLVNSNIQTFHYPLKQSDNNLVALGSCDDPDTHANDCLTEIGFSLDDNDVFTNADRIEFNSNAPDGLYTIRYELVDTANGQIQVLSNTHEVQVTLDTTGPTIDPVSNEPSNPSCSDNTVEIFATVIDVSSINKVWLNYNVTNEFDIKVKGFRMSLIGDNSYKRDISLPPLNSTRDDGLEVSYEVEANDTLGNLAKSDLQRYVYDCQNPIASFTEIPVNPDEGQEVSFDASGSSDTVTTNNNDLIFEWNFGDGNTGSGKTVTHTYKDNGKYNVTLTVTDKAGNSDETSEIKVVNNVVPTVKDCVITPNPGEEGSEVELTCSFSNPGVLDTHTATINWGDGAIEEGTITEVDGSGTVTASHTYKDNNDYNVVVNVTDKDGGIGTDETTANIVNVAPAVVANKPSDKNERDVLEFTGSFTDQGILDTHTASIDWGDGSPVVPCEVTEAVGSGTVSCSHPYENNGNYPIILTVTDNFGDSGSSETTATILDQLPTASFTENLTNPKEGQPVQFTDTSTSYDEIVSWHWEFGDGDTSDEQNPTHTYKDNGVYTVTLTVKDSDGSTNTTSEEKVVSNVAPTVELDTPEPTTEGSEVTFTATVTDPGTLDTHTFLWDFGDDSGTVETTEPTVKHTYLDNDEYPVTLTVTDNDGGVGTDETTATILDGMPTANFTEEPTSPEEGQLVQFTNTSTSPADPIVSWLWNFGDGETSTLPNPTHIYVDDDTYNVSLTVTDKDGSTNTKWEPKVVSNAAPVVTDISVTPNTPDEGQEVTLTATFTDAGKEDTHRLPTIDWGDGTITNGTVTESDGSGTVSGSHVYADNKNGGYEVTVTVWDDSPDSGSDTFVVTVNNVAPTVLAAATQTVAKEDVVSISTEFTDPGVLDEHNATINWGDGSTTEALVTEPNSPTGTVSGNHIYENGGTFNITVTVTDKDGGSGSNTSIAEVGDFVIDLKNQGWNLFSVPKVLENNDLAALTSDLDYSIILTYKDGKWIQPATVDPLKAYWINMGQPGKLLLRFKNASCTDSVCPVPGARQLNAGWELIGFTDTKPLMSRLALYSIKDSYSQWFGLVNNVWIPHIFGQWPDTNLEPGRGYWIFMTKPSTLAVLSF